MNVEYSRRFVRRGLWCRTKTAYLRKAVAEAMECRTLLSGYNLDTVGVFGPQSNGVSPAGGLISDSGGNFYGTTNTGGASNDGTVYAIAHGTQAITTIASFNGINGANPYGHLVRDSIGNFYGTTTSGGATNDGTIFEIANGTAAITTIASFNFFNTGGGPQAGLVLDSGGNLFGTTRFGGARQCGTVFEIARGTATITTIAIFLGSNGIGPAAGLTMDLSGNLYGTTTGGGANGDGTVFEIAHGTTVISTIASFNFATNDNPDDGVILDSSGNLYGTTYDGGASNDGTVFKIVRGTTTITTLASFNSSNGANPGAGLILDSTGNLYGTTDNGTPGNFGTVFKVAGGTTTISTLASFNYANGAGSEGGLMLDASGNLYGTTSAGGVVGAGTVFEVPRGASAIYTIASFGSTNGQNPYSGLTQDSSGNLYGTTSAGGARNYGEVFEIAQGTPTITPLASFNSTNGFLPYGPLILDSSGDLFGTTFAGGAFNDGTVFEILHGTAAITTVASFNWTNGSDPYGGLLRDSSGNLFGTTSAGGASNDGTVYEIVHGTAAISTIASFTLANGGNPGAGLVLDSRGNLYGTTTFYDGTTHFGTVFEILHGTMAITTIASFNGINGTDPGGLILSTSGNLYGTVGGGGAGYDGAVFEIAHGTTAISTVASFNGIDGTEPGGLVMDPSGNLYGTTSFGGASDDGAVFEIALGTNMITTLASFDSANGASPGSGPGQLHLHRSM